MGKPIHLPLNTGFIPDFSNFHNMVLAAGIFLYFAGMEMQAVHVRHLDNPIAQLSPIGFDRDGSGGRHLRPGNAGRRRR